MISFTPFPILATKNLILRRMNYNDIADLFEMRSDPRMHQFTDTKIEKSTEETLVYIDKMNKGIDDNQWVIWVIEHKQSNRVIGSISIWNIDYKKNSGELGYGINPKYQGMGFMKESLMKVVEYGLDVMALNELYAYTEEENLRSIKLLEKCNFKKMGRVDEKGCFNKNKIFHIVIYKITNSKNIIVSESN